MSCSCYEDDGAPHEVRSEQSSAPVAVAPPLTVMNKRRTKEGDIKIDDHKIP